MSRWTVIAIPMLLAACIPDTFVAIGPASRDDSGMESIDASDASPDAPNPSDGDGAVSSDASIDSMPETGVDAGPCGDANDVLHGGKCFYLDGTAGACSNGYTLSSDAALASILQANPSAFQWKGFHTKASYNCCVFTSSSPRNYGMVTNCNKAPFAANEPAWGGTACTNITGAAKIDQLTLCEKTL